MSAQGNLTLNTKAYVPYGNVDGIAKWQLVGDTTFGGATSAATESVRGPSKDGLFRIKFKLDVPKAAESASACACAGDVIGRSIVNIDVTIPASFTSAERTDLRTRIQDLVSNAVFTSAIDGLEPSW